MSTSEDSATDAGAAADRSAEDDADPGRPSLERVTDNLPTLLAWGVLVVCVLFALVAAVGLYQNITRLISVWVGPRYQPAFRAGFNLAVLLLAATGVSLALRRLR